MKLLNKLKAWQKGFTLVWLIITVAILGLIAAVFLPQHTARADLDGTGLQFINRWNQLTNCTLLTASGTTPTTNATPGVVSAATSGQIVFPIYRGRGMAFFASVQCGPGTNAVATYGVDLTPDGTNWTTTQPVQFTITCNGTTNQIGGTNILADRLDNARWGKVTTMTGGTAANIITNNWLVWSGIP